MDQLGFKRQFFLNWRSSSWRIVFWLRIEVVLLHWNHWLFKYLLWSLLPQRLILEIVLIKLLLWWRSPSFLCVPSHLWFGLISPRLVLCCSPLLLFYFSNSQLLLFLLFLPSQVLIFLFLFSSLLVFIWLSVVCLWSKW